MTDNKYSGKKEIQKTTLLDMDLRMVNPPIHNGSTVLFDSYKDLLKASSGKYEGICYGTDRLPAQRMFEEALCRLEGGNLTRAFQSGISAIINTFLAFTSSGDHILLCENVYGPNANFCRKVLSKFNVECDFIPGNVGSDIMEYIRPNTRLIFLESPGSNTFEIQDVPVITGIARRKNIVTVIDNTWATPLFLKPFELGVDVSVQSVTKYISGHSDVLMGAVTVNEEYSNVFAEFYRTMELFASPNDCYLSLRGLQTLEVRLRQHEQAALNIAEWLDTRTEVGEVIHPALESHPQHLLWMRDFSGSSGLFGFTFANDIDEDEVGRFVDALSIFGLGFSWGGFKSLLTASRYKRPSNSALDGKIIVRLNIGLEQAEDLMDDLTKGFSALS